MRKIAAAAVTAAVALACAPAATAGITDPGNNGHPSENPTGHCPPGQNQDATPGALKKCD